MKKTAAAALVLSVLAQAPVRADATPALIAFESRAAGNSDIWTMNSDGGDLRKITTSVQDDQAPVWSPDGTRIAFHSFRDGDAEIYTMAPDGSDVRKLTSNSVFDAYPVWAAGRIAFVSLRAGSQQIYSMTPDGTDVKKMTQSAAGAGYPAWTPDGSRLLYVEPDDTDNEIWSVAADGTGARKLTDDVCGDQAPSVSPDGTRVLFSSDCAPVIPGAGDLPRVAGIRPWIGVSVMNIDGTGAHTVSRELWSYEDWPTWSGDGSQIVFASDRDGGAGGVNAMDIVIADADGSHARNLTHSELVFDGFPVIQPQHPLARPDIVGEGHITAGGPWVSQRSLTVATNADSADGFFLPLAWRASTGDTLRAWVTRNGTYAPYALSMNFHGPNLGVLGRNYLGGCTGIAADFTPAVHPFAEVSCKVPSGATTVEVTSYYGADLDVMVTNQH